MATKATTTVGKVAASTILEIVKEHPYSTTDELIQLYGQRKVEGLAIQSVSTLLSMLFRAGCVGREQDPQDRTGSGRIPYRYHYVKEYNGEPIEVPGGSRGPRGPRVADPQVQRRSPVSTTEMPTINLPGMKEPVTIAQAKSIYMHLRAIFGGS